MADNVKCPQCGSRDLVKIRPPATEGQTSMLPEYTHYKCQICGRGFNITNK